MIKRGKADKNARVASAKAVSTANEPTASHLPRNHAPLRKRHPSVKSLPVSRLSAKF
jgi:hypothetical protein